MKNNKLKQMADLANALLYKPNLLAVGLIASSPDAMVTEPQLSQAIGENQMERLIILMESGIVSYNAPYFTIAEACSSQVDYLLNLSDSDAEVDPYLIKLTALIEAEEQETFEEGN